jgi:hypothetical protein
LGDFFRCAGWMGSGDVDSAGLDRRGVYKVEEA